MKNREGGLLTFKGVSVAIMFGLVLFTLPLVAQPVDSQDTIDRIEKDIVNYLRTNDGLEEHGSSQEYKQRITIIECVDKTVLGYSKVGIYAFSVNTSHSKTFLLLKNGLRYEIVDPDSLINTLQKATALLNDAKLSDTRSIEYIESIIRIYKMNEGRNPAKLESKR
jgi:hypothetical protein